MTEDEEIPASDEEALEFEEHDDGSEEESGSEFEGSDEAPEAEGVADNSSVDIPLTSKIKSKPRASRSRAKSMDSDALDEDDLDGENASEDEALMLEAAIHASLTNAPEVDENGAGPSTSRQASGPGGSRNKAAALRAAAAERRLGIKPDSDAEFIDLDDDEESYVSSDDEESDTKKKGAKGGKKGGTMTLAQMKAERRAARLAAKAANAPLASVLRKKRKELGRKLTYVCNVHSPANATLTYALM